MRRVGGWCEGVVSVVIEKTKKENYHSEKRVGGFNFCPQF